MLSLIIFFAFIISSVKAETSENTWQEMTPMPTARYWFGLVSAADKIFAIGGQTRNTLNLDINEMYDPASNTWVTMADMPTPRCDFGITEYENKIYCIGGDSGGHMIGTNEVYDPASNSWSSRTAMPTPREGITANTVNGKIYVIGGNSETSMPCNVTEVYDIATDTWSSKAQISERVARYASAVVGDKIYIIGGVAGANNPFLGRDGSVRLVQVYNCITDMWTNVGTLPEYQLGLAAGATSGIFAPEKIYVIGTSTWVYAPDAKTWTQGDASPNNRIYVSVTMFNDLLYVMGGIPNADDGTVFAVNERYTPFGFSGEYPEASFNPVVLIVGVVVAATVIAATGVTVYHFKHAPAKTPKTT
jgi:N-acetylneuraminic acid mutarotase